VKIQAGDLGMAASVGFSRIGPCITPITVDTVHASFLVFPELAALSKKLISWVSE